MQKTILVNTEAAVIEHYVAPVGAAIILGVEIETLRTWRNRKQGPNYRRFGRLIRYSLSDLARYADQAIVEYETSPRRSTLDSCPKK